MMENLTYQMTERIIYLSKLLKADKETPRRNLPIARFAKKFEVAVNGCWNWTGALNRGYGSFDRKGSHRFIYDFVFGAIPESYDVHHKCFNKKCCNPYHLQACTRRENIRETSKLKTHCPKGHPYAGENLYLTKENWRVCLECRRTRYKKSN
jgi:hypothetical protein